MDLPDMWRSEVRRGVAMHKTPTKKQTASAPIDIPPGSLRVWWYPPDGVRAFRHPVADLAQAKFALTMLDCYDVFLDPHHASALSSSGLEIFKNGKWTEWHNADGNDIRWVMADGEAA